MSAPASAGGKLRLSEVVRALRAGDVELDCKAVVLTADEEGVCSVFDFDRAAVKNVGDVKLLLLHCGLQALASQVMADVPEAVAAVAAADARSRQMRGQAGLLGELLGRANDEAVDGKEGE